MLEKIKSLYDIGSILAEKKSQGKAVVHCHGVFDLLHPGHLRHLQEAKRQGDTLVVSITPDRFVNKGPGRPAFTETLRLEQLAALSCVDYVVLNDSPDAVPMIQKIKPSIYVKGIEYQNPEDDVTGKISVEARAVEEGGGRIYFTEDIVFSSSALINRHFDADAERIAPFIQDFKKRFSSDSIIDALESLAALKVLVVGDAIIDEYQYIEPLGQSGKGVHMTARCLEKETFLGGSLIIANHLAQYAGQVTLLTAVGEECPHAPMIRSKLDSRVVAEWISLPDRQTLTKRRYVLKDGNSITKLFETYSSNDPLLSPEQTETACAFLKEQCSNFDLILVCDFGNGFTNEHLIDSLCEIPSFLALNTQTNSGNRGFNVVTRYHRADFISLNEPEIRLATQDRKSSIELLAHDVSSLLQCPALSITRGVQGVYFHTKEGEVSVPALTSHAIDRVGAGDCYFSLASLSIAKGHSPLLAAFLGSAAAALDVQIIGNREAVSKVGLCKYVTRLLK